MTEPLYTYIKGQGWITTPGVEHTLRCGTRVHLQAREPQLGERYACTPSNIPGNPWASDNGPKLEYFASEYIHVTFQDLYLNDGEKYLNPLHYFVVFVPI